MDKDRLFEIRLKKPLKDFNKNKIREIRRKYINEKNTALGFELLSFFYDYSTLKQQFKSEKKINWEDNWLDDSKLIWATFIKEIDAEINSMSTRTLGR